MRIKAIKELVKLISINEEKCVNCHACISVCPVKYCNDGSGDTIHINSDLCIGCGNCIKRCTHNAREYVDDIGILEDYLLQHQKVVVVAAPSIVSSFPKAYLRINGWFASLGIDVFDVSFGAELTVKSYIDYLSKSNPKCLIAQPCPAIVTYIELYTPELLKYLAPVDSPIGHTIKMIQEYHKEYADHKIVVLSPCLAKKREVAETFDDVISVSFKSLDDYLRRNEIDITTFDEIPYRGLAAERAVFFPAPGGLLTTIERYLPNIREKARQIEGHENIYRYLDGLSKDIQENKAPLIIDCLNCEHGCNVGCLGLSDKKTLDEIENVLKQRKTNNIQEISNIEESLQAVWRDDLFIREYSDKSDNNRLIYPNSKEIHDIYTVMGKHSKADLKDCNSCGYGNCEGMAVAIRNGLNKAENCHFYLAQQREKMMGMSVQNDDKIYDILYHSPVAVCVVDATHNVTLVNDSLCSLLNISKERILHTAIFSKWMTQLNEKIRIKVSSDLIVDMYVIKNEDKFICFFSKYYPRQSAPEAQT